MTDRTDHETERATLQASLDVAPELTDGDRE